MSTATPRPSGTVTRGRLALAVTTAGLALTLLATPTLAATSNVVIHSFASGFEPPTSTVAIGDTMDWDNQDGVLHSTTSDAPLSLWTIDIPSGQDRTRIFHFAGSYAYHCRIHPSMHGTVVVKMKSSPASGSTATTFTITVADKMAPSGFHYVIERKVGGGSFSSWKTITAKSTTFHTSNPNTYRFRMHLRKDSNGAVSGNSPTRKVVVNP